VENTTSLDALRLPVSRERCDLSCQEMLSSVFTEANLRDMDTIISLLVTAGGGMLDEAVDLIDETELTTVNHANIDEALRCDDVTSITGTDVVSQMTETECAVESIQLPHDVIILTTVTRNIHEPPPRMYV